jgi:UDP-2-acetamido-3-amino-2,3-dideoxy-glucuronate N-acetyltransferase
LSGIRHEIAHFHISLMALAGARLKGAQLMIGPRDVQVAVVGCGYWGRNLVRCFHEFGALAAICDPDQALAAAMGDRLAVPVLGFGEILRENAVRGVVIAAPAALHVPLARQALQAGKHVFVEKPIALSVREGEALRDQARTSRLTLMVGHLLHYHPAYCRLRELTAQGALGPLRYVYSNRLSMGKLRSEEDVIWSFAPHDISMILGLAGEEPTCVEAHSSKALSNPLADIGHLHLTFGSGLRAHIHVSWLHPFKEHRLVVVGERACAVFNDVEPWPSKLTITPYRQDGGALAKGEPAPVPIDPAEPLKAEAEHFLACIESGQPPRTDGDEAVRVLRVLAQASNVMSQAA